MRLEHLINPRRVGILLGALALYFAAQSLLVEYLIENVLHPVQHRTLIMALDLFSVNAEKTVPTWYAILLLFTASVLLSFITTMKLAVRDRHALYWLGLTAVFIYLSMDEGAVIHEIVADALQESLSLTGFFTFGWQMVAAPLIVLFGLLYLRFLFHLPRRTRLQFLLAAALYVGGALVIEGISANQYFIDDGVSFEYLAIATIEELCEMLGIVVFIYALLSYIATMGYSLAVMPRADGAAAGAVEPKVPVRLVATVVLFVAAMNVVIVGWSVRQAAGVGQVQAVDYAQPAALTDQLAAGGVVVTRLDGRFGPENAAARDVTRALLDLYRDVMVVVLMPDGTSYVLAADDLPYDRDTLTTLLNANGVFQFILFDTAAVAVLSGE